MTRNIRLGAIFWLLTVEFFIAQFAAAAAFPGYSALTNDISLLGVTSCGTYINPAPGGIMPVCSPLSLVFNAGMVVNGLLVVLGALLTRKFWPQGKLTLLALWLITIGGDGSMLAGIFPLNTILPLHVVGALLALGVAALGFFVLAKVVWNEARAFAVYSILTGLIALVAFLAYASGNYLGIGRGTVERLSAWPYTIWYMVTGALILSGRLRFNRA